MTVNKFYFKIYQLYRNQAFVLLEYNDKYNDGNLE